MQRYRIHLATAIVVLVTAMLALFLIPPLLTHKTAVQSPTASIQPPTKADLLRLVNAERAKAHVAPLVDDPRLDQSAQRKADDMFKYGYDAHISPHDGKHGYEYINDVGISCKTDSENLYWGNSAQYPSSSAGAVTWWMSSKPHHDALLNAVYSLTGFGIDGTKIVEHFCQQ